MTKSNLISDLSSLLSIQKLTFEKLTKYSIDCLSYDLCEAKLSGEDTFSVDIGYGTLIVYFTDDEMKFRFNPSSDLENSLVDVIKGKQEKPLVDDAEKAIINKLLLSYKELF